MTFRDNDDDTSSGKKTQGGGRARRGNSIFWVLGAAVIALAVLIAVATLPKKHAPAEEGTVPVSSSVNALGPSGPAGAVAAPIAPTSASPSH